MQPYIKLYRLYLPHIHVGVAQVQVWLLSKYISPNLYNCSFLCLVIFDGRIYASTWIMVSACRLIAWQVLDLSVYILFFPYLYLKVQRTGCKSLLWHSYLHPRCQSITRLPLAAAGTFCFHLTPWTVFSFWRWFAFFVFQSKAIYDFFLQDIFN